MNAAFDVGADDGFHGIVFAFLNPKINIYAFEPIKGSRKKIINNLKRVEKFFKINIKNYKIINCAISDYNGYAFFYETNYKVASSLLRPRKNLHKHWKNPNDLLLKTVSAGLKIKKKYKVKVSTLRRFCKKNSIKLINYLHVDAQGNDLNVIKGLGEYKKCLMEGIAEIPEMKKFNIYNNEQTLKKLKKNFKQWKYEIIDIKNVQKNMPYLDVHFRTTNKKIINENQIEFIHPSKRILRLFKRIFSNKINFKDIIYLYLYKFRKVYK